MSKCQKIGVTAFIKNFNDQILILRRSNQESFLSGYFELPGGKVEFGEDPEDALKREVKEETCLDIIPIKQYSLFSYISDNGNHVVDIQFITELMNFSEVKLSSEHDDFKWINEDEVESYKITDLMKDCIYKGFKSS